MQPTAQKALFEKIYAHPDVFVIRVPFTNISTNDTNCYVVKSGDDVLVVDTGAPTDEGLTYLMAALDELGVDRSKASFFLTHFHLDHAGLADTVIPPEAKLYVSEAEFSRTRPGALHRNADILCARMLQEGTSEEEAATYRTMQQRGTKFVETPHNLVLVKPGDTISVGSCAFDVIDTTGHTPGHMSLHEEKAGLFFGGDHMLFTISPSVDYFFDGRDSIQTYLDNLKRLSTLDLAVFLHSHGEIRDDFKERIAWLLEHHEERLKEVLHTINEQPHLSGVEIIKRLSWNVPADSWEDISLLQRAIIITQSLAILDHLEKTGKIVHETDDSDIRRYRLAV